MADNNFQDFGRQMSDAVQDALHSGDFSSIKNIVNSTLNTVLTKTIDASKPFTDASARRQGGAPPQSGQNGMPPNGQRGGQYTPPQNGQYGTPPPDGQYSGKYTSPPGGRQNARRGAGVNGQQQYGVPYYTAPPKTSMIKKPPKPPVSGASGVVMLVFGIIGAVITGIIELIAGIVAITGASVSASFVAAVMSPFLITSIVFIVRGGMICGRFKRYKNYWRLAHDKTVCELTRLAAAVRKPVGFVKKELRRMLDAGMFPQGYLDDEQTCLMLGDETYKQYVNAKQQRKQIEEQAAREKAAKENMDPNSAQAVIAEGRECLKRISDANDALTGADISDKLTRLEDITAKIFMHIEENPAKLPEIRRFMSYYLPTTIKLVTSYRDFEEQPVQGDNIKNAKGEILEMLDTINAAFATLLDSLFEGDAMDISSDISAMKTMLAQEGLAEKDFKDAK